MNEEPNKELVDLFKIEEPKKNLVVLPESDSVSVIAELTNSDTKYVRDNFKSLIDGSISIPGGKVEEALLKLKEKYTNAVLCTVTKKRNWFENIFYHSVSKSLAHYSDVALLCLHEE